MHPRALQILLGMPSSLLVLRPSGEAQAAEVDLVVLRFLCLSGGGLVSELVSLGVMTAATQAIEALLPIRRPWILDMVEQCSMWPVNALPCSTVMLWSIWQVCPGCHDDQA